MIKRLILVAAIGAFAIQPVYPQSQAAGPVKQIKAGEVVLFGDTFTVKVTQSTKSPFSNVKLKGEPLVVLIELDGGKKGVTLAYNLTADARSSDVYLTSGALRSAPRAVMEDFPSWGGDNDKEVEVLDRRDTDGNVSLSFAGKGAVSLLFELPPGQTKTPKKLSVSLRTTEPQSEAYSFVVNL